MDLHRGGWIDEPRQFHAEDACDLWKEHGTRLPSSHWVDQFNEAEDKKYPRALPVMVIILTVVRLDEVDKDPHHLSPARQHGPEHLCVVVPQGPPPLHRNTPEPERPVGQSFASRPVDLAKSHT